MSATSVRSSRTTGAESASSIIVTRERQRQVDDPADGRVDEAAGEARDDPQHDAGEHGDHRGGQRDAQGPGHRQHQPGQQVAAGARLDAERVLPAHAAERALRVDAVLGQQVLVEGVGVEHADRHEDGRRDGAEHDEGRGDERDHRQPVGPVSGDGQLPRRTTCDLGRSVVLEGDGGVVAVRLQVRGQRHPISLSQPERAGAAPSGMGTLCDPDHACDREAVTIWSQGATARIVARSRLRRQILRPGGVVPPPSLRSPRTIVCDLRSNHVSV